MDPRRRVLILGGGFAGIGAAQGLKDADAEVVLVDGHDYHTFQPLLYQVATDLLHPPSSGIPSATSSMSSRTLPCIKRPRRSSTSQADRSSSRRWSPITYDQLVLALGARVNFFGVKGAQDHAFPMYTLADAMRIREHILQKWQAADRDPSR